MKVWWGFLAWSGVVVGFTVADEFGFERAATVIADGAVRVLANGDLVVSAAAASSGASLGQAVKVAGASAMAFSLFAATSQDPAVLTQEFWPRIVACTLIAVTVWATARYLRDRRGLNER